MVQYISKRIPPDLQKAPQMILYQTLVIVLLLLLRAPLSRLLKRGTTKNDKSLGKFLFMLNRWDQTFRIIQYALILFAGQLQTSAIYIIDHAGLMMIGRAHQLDFLSNFMGSTRKLIRVARLLDVVGDVRRSLTDLKARPSKLRALEFAMQLLSDFFNLLYYFTDHFTLLFLFGLLTNFENEYVADYSGTVFWIFSNFFLFLKDLLLIFRLRKEKGKACEREVYFAKLDLVKNCVDTVLALCFFQGSLLSKRTVGILGVGSSIIALSDFWK